MFTSPLVASKPPLVERYKKFSFGKFISDNLRRSVIGNGEFCRLKPWSS